MRLKKFLIVLLSLLFVSGCSGQAKQTADVKTPVETVIPSEQIIITIPENESRFDTIVGPPTFTPSPEPTATPTPTPTPKPTDIPEPTPTPKPYCADNNVYTFGWISDPQHYSAKYPEYYESMTAFLRDHREELHLEYIIHTGDLVNKTSDEKQWEVAVRAQSYIDDIPNGVLAGNHDCQQPKLYGPYSTHFGEAHYKERPWYGDSYEDNRGHYDLMTIGKTDYLFVYMSFGLDDACIKWLNKVFEEHPDRVGFLMVHEYFNNDYKLSKDGIKLYNEVVLKNPNLYIVLCGHRYGAYTRSSEIDDDGDGDPDRIVDQMMFNYQAAGKTGGDGYLRLIQMDEENKKMHILTYSPALDDFNRFDDPAKREIHYEIDETSEDFVLPIPWM